MENILGENHLTKKISQEKKRSSLYLNQTYISQIFIRKNWSFCVKLLLFLL